MKILYVALFSLMIGFAKAEDWHAIYNDDKKSWIERWGYLVSQAQNMPEETRIEILSKIIGNHDNSNYSSASIDLVKNAQAILLSTPGHAEYYGKKLEKTPMHHERRYWYPILRNLPSPETVSVLGKLLSDDQERPALAKDHSNIDEYIDAHPNCDRAAKTLQSMLANPPVPKEEYFNFERDLEVWRSWWENVKSGKQAFSFEGENVEYRFKPDGTWIKGAIGTTKRSDRATHSFSGQLRPEKQGKVKNDEHAQGNSNSDKMPRPVLWIAGIFSLFLACAYYFLLIRRRNSNGKNMG
jgi:hypothetical protein